MNNMNAKKCDEWRLRPKLQKIRKKISNHKRIKKKKASYNLSPHISYSEAISMWEVQSPVLILAPTMILPGPTRVIIVLIRISTDPTKILLVSLQSFELWIGKIWWIKKNGLISCPSCSSSARYRLSSGCQSYVYLTCMLESRNKTSYCVGSWRSILVTTRKIYLGFEDKCIWRNGEWCIQDLKPKQVYFGIFFVS